MATVKEREGKRKKSSTNSAIEFVVIIAVALGLAVGIQAFLVKPFRIPSPSMVPTLKVGQRVLVNRLGPHFGDPSRGDIVVFKPPAGADSQQCGIPSEPTDGRPCEKPTPSQSKNNFIKRVVAQGRQQPRLPRQEPGRPVRAAEGAVHREGHSVR
jgi:signal peptidase I